MNEFEHRINKFLDAFIKESFDSNLIKYDYNLLTFDNNQIFIVNEDILMENINLAIIYSELINEYILNYNIDFCVSFCNIESLFYNSSLSFRKNQDVFFVNSKNIIKKSIHGINTLITKYGSNESDENYSVLIPMIFKKTSDKYSSILSLIKLLNGIVNLSRVFVLSIFDFTKDSQLTNLSKFKEDNIDIHIIDKSLVDTSNIFERLLDLSIIDNNLFSKINMFTNQSNNTEITLPKIIQNTLFLHFKNITSNKSSKICLSLETILESTEIVKYTNLLGSYIVAIKINSNFIYNETILKGLRRLADYHNFLIIDDKKLVIKNITDLKKINLFKFVDVISLNIKFISDEIETWFLEQRKSINKHASFIINIDNESEKELASKIYNYFNNFVFGVIGLDKTDSEMVTIIDYKNVSHLNDDFKSLKNSDLVVLEDELYKSKNPIEIVTKINKITYS
jgi:hypothetical protein